MTEAFTASNGVEVHINPAGFVFAHFSSGWQKPIGFREGSELDCALSEWYRYREDSEKLPDA